MQIIIKNGENYSLTNIPDNELELIQDEVITDFTLSEEQEKSINYGTSFTVENGEVILGDETEYLAKIQAEQLELVKQEKAKQINSLASITGQINLLGGIMEEMVLEIPEEKRTPTMQKGLQVVSGIKEILSK